MSAEALTWAFRQHPPSRTAKLLLIIMANFSDSDFEFVMRQKRLCLYLEAQSKTACLNLRQLIDSKLISEILNEDGSSKRPKAYRLNIDPSLIYEKNATYDPAGENVAYLGQNGSEVCQNGSNVKTASGSGSYKISTVRSTKVDLSKQSTEGGVGGGSQAEDFSLESDEPEIDPLAVPTALFSPEVHEAWEDWKKYRRDEVKKPVTAVSAKFAFRDLKNWGSKRWVGAIEFSIKRCYRGLFEEKSVTRTSYGRPVPPPSSPVHPVQNPIPAKEVTFA